MPLICPECKGQVMSLIGGVCSDCRNPGQSETRKAYANFSERFWRNYNQNKGINLTPLEMSFIAGFMNQ